MVTTKIKTFAFLLKCLKYGIPIYKMVLEIDIRINPLVIFRASLLEITMAINAGTYFIKIPKEHAAEIFAAQEALAKGGKENVKTATPDGTDLPLGEPGYEEVEHQVAAV